MITVCVCGAEKKGGGHCEPVHSEVTCSIMNGTFINSKHSNLFLPKGIAKTHGINVQHKFY